MLWSDMDTAWLTNVLELAPRDHDVVVVDDSLEKNEKNSDNTCTGVRYSKSSCMQQALFGVSMRTSVQPADSFLRCALAREAKQPKTFL